MEDHLGDMDFKVAGTPDGVTAIQMDIKIDGIDRAILQEALQQAKEGRMHILEKWQKPFKSQEKRYPNMRLRLLRCRSIRTKFAM